MSRNDQSTLEAHIGVAAIGDLLVINQSYGLREYGMKSLSQTSGAGTACFIYLSSQRSQQIAEQRNDQTTLFALLALLATTILPSMWGLLPLVSVELREKEVIVSSCCMSSRWSSEGEMKRMLLRSAQKPELIYDFFSQVILKNS